RTDFTPPWFTATTFWGLADRVLGKSSTSRSGEVRVVKVGVTARLAVTSTLMTSCSIKTLSFLRVTPDQLSDTPDLCFPWPEDPPRAPLRWELSGWPWATATLNSKAINARSENHFFVRMTLLRNTEL